MNTLYQLNDTIKNIADKRYPYNNVIGLVRSILALGLLLTLLFTSTEYLYLENAAVEHSQWNFFTLLGVENAVYMKFAAIALLLVIISGYFPQVTCFLHWWIASSFMLFCSFIDGGDQIHNNITLILIPLCLTDPRINHWHTSKVKRESVLNLFGVFTVWLIKLQVAVIYLHASVGKYSVTEWANGTALYYWQNHTMFGSQPFIVELLMPIFQNGILLPLMTYAALLFELILFAALFMSYERRKALLPLALGFHFAIIIFYGIFSFFFSIAAIAILYLLPPDYSLKFDFSRRRKDTSSYKPFKFPVLISESRN